jgi:hypothetical protein
VPPQTRSRGSNTARPPTSACIPFRSVRIWPSGPDHCPAPPICQVRGWEFFWRGFALDPRQQDSRRKTKNLALNPGHHEPGGNPRIPAEEPRDFSTSNVPFCLEQTMALFRTNGPPIYQPWLRPGPYTHYCGAAAGHAGCVCFKERGHLARIGQ